MAKDDEPRIEEMDEGPPPLMDAGAMPSMDDLERGQSKSEKKVRKAVEKLGLKKVQGINKVSIRKRKTVFVILSPDVYKAGKNDGYVVFGEAKV